MGRQIIIEVCLDSLQSARTVQKVAAEFEGRVKWRIELCSNLIHGGGLTPSIGLLRSIRRFLPEIGIMAMIRPRIGNFTYSEDEIVTMEEEVLTLKEEGVTGFVFGCLTSARTIDFPSMTRLCKAAESFPVTFHRAIDLMSTQGDAISKLENDPGTSNVTRILTSGGASTAWDGRETLKSLTEVTGSQITILPGSGINANNLPDLLRQLPRLTEIHLTSSEAVTAEDYQPEEGYGESHESLEEALTKFGFGSNQVWTMNEDKIRAVFKVIDDVGKTH